MNEPGFLAMPDLAARASGGAVVYANDELFAEKENLIMPGDAVFDPDAFGHKGKIYDGWETRRRREPGHDFAIVRLGSPGVVHGVVIDTAWFTGNFPPFGSVEGCTVESYPSPAELLDNEWRTLLPKAPLLGDTKNLFEVAQQAPCTHVRLTIYPDGGVARFRVHGEPLPVMPTDGLTDLAAQVNGGSIFDCSNMFYGSPINLIQPGPARSMGDGWENARRRDDGNDFVEFRLASPGVVRVAEIDTSCFVGNAPGWVALNGRDRHSGRQDDWRPLLPKTRVQPDTPHRFTLSDERPVSHVRLDVYPDGGLARVRLWGTATG